MTVLHVREVLIAKRNCWDVKTAEIPLLSAFRLLVRAAIDSHYSRPFFDGPAASNALQERPEFAIPNFLPLAIVPDRFCL